MEGNGFKYSDDTSSDKHTSLIITSSLKENISFLIESVLSV